MDKTGALVSGSRGEGSRKAFYNFINTQKSFLKGITPTEMCALEVLLATYLQMSPPHIFLPFYHPPKEHACFVLFDYSIQFPSVNSHHADPCQALRVFLVLNKTPALTNTRPVEDADAGASLQLNSISSVTEARPWRFGDTGTDMGGGWRSGA